ncbi:hypothetical protein D3C75_561610 [compost metagenome]
MQAGNGNEFSTDRLSGGEYADVRAEPGAAAGAGGRNGRVVYRGRAAGPGISRPCGLDERAVPAGPVPERSGRANL